MGLLKLEMNYILCHLDRVLLSSPILVEDNRPILVFFNKAGETWYPISNNAKYFTHLSGNLVKSETDQNYFHWKVMLAESRPIIYSGKNPISRNQFLLTLKFQLIYYVYVFHEFFQFQLDKLDQDMPFVSNNLLVIDIMIGRLVCIDISIVMGVKMVTCRG